MLESAWFCPAAMKNFRHPCVHATKRSRCLIGRPIRSMVAHWDAQQWVRRHDPPLAGINWGLCWTAVSSYAISAKYITMFPSLFTISVQKVHKVWVTSRDREMTPFDQSVPKSSPRLHRYETTHKKTDIGAFHFLCVALGLLIFDLLYEAEELGRIERCCKYLRAYKLTEKWIARLLDDTLLLTDNLPTHQFLDLCCNIFDTIFPTVYLAESELYIHCTLFQK